MQQMRRRELGLYRLGRKRQWGQREISLQSSHLKRGSREGKAQRGNRHKWQQNKPLLELSENSLPDVWLRTGRDFQGHLLNQFGQGLPGAIGPNTEGRSSCSKKIGQRTSQSKRLSNCLMCFEIQMIVFSEKSDHNISVYFLP